MKLDDDARAGSSDAEVRVLTLAPSGRDAGLAEQALTAAGFVCHVCASLDELSREIAIGAGVVLVADEALTPVSAADPDEWAGAEPLWSQLPFVVLTGDRVSSRHSLAAMRQLEQRTNATFLQRPVPKVTLISTIRAALESRRRQYVVRDLLMKLEENVRQRDEFLATLGHELRNPLAAIRSGTEVLRVSGDARSDEGGALAIVERNIEHMVRLIDDLLDVSRITMGKIALKTELTDLRVTVRRAIEARRASPLGSESELSFVLADQPLMLQADPVRLAQIVNNLLDNAIKYTNDGERRIRVAAVRDGEAASLTVEDNGVGLSMDNIDQVFEMFTQVDSDRTDGLGIGLALTRALVEMHGGRIVAHSRGVGQGSRFTVRIPLAQERETSMADESPSKGGKLSGHRVLVVDDNRDAADAVALLLRALGAAATVVYDGHAALEAIDKIRPTAVLLDIGMPDMDGYEVGKRIRARESSQDILLIAVTGWGQDESSQRRQDAGLDHHLVKPIKIDEVQRLLTSREL